MIRSTTAIISIGVLLPLSLGGCDDFRGDGVQHPKPPVESESSNANTESRSWATTPIAKWESWKPNEFFDSPNEIKMCEAISRRSRDELADLLESKVPLNNPGKCGVTVLYWAYLEGNLDAFNLLLKHGADPEQRLASNIRGRRFEFMQGDTVMFSSIRQDRAEFCIAALKYSKNPNHLDFTGENLLHPFVSRALGTEEQLKSLIDAGVDVNRKGRFGCTPCHLGLSLAPGLSLQLLKAGADPSIRDDEGKDLADRIESKLGSSSRSGKYDRRLDPLIVWLNENYRKIRLPKQ